MTIEDPTKQYRDTPFIVFRQTRTPIWSDDKDMLLDLKRIPVGSVPRRSANPSSRNSFPMMVTPSRFEVCRVEPLTASDSCE